MIEFDKTASFLKFLFYRETKIGDDINITISMILYSTNYQFFICGAFSEGFTITFLEYFLRVSLFSEKAICVIVELLKIGVCGFLQWCKRLKEG